MADAATLQTELDELRALKLKLIRSGGVQEWNEGGHRIKRYSFREIDDAIARLERELTAVSGGNFHFAEPSL